MIDFNNLARDLLSNSKSLLSEWFPAGKFRGAEFVIGDLHGSAGDSLSINWRSGMWKDFATGETGGDLISLYAAAFGLSQIDAAKALGGQDDGQPRQRVAPAQKNEPEPPKRIVVMPARGFSPCVHPKFGEPSTIWEYHNQDGALLGYVARYDPPNERKQIVPWTYAQDGGWGMGQWNDPRPLYGLDRLTNPDRTPNTKPVLLVEGEKAADAAFYIAGHVYAVLTWPGGAQAWRKVDWSPIAGRAVLMWPDADEAGVKCMREIAAVIDSPEVKLINTDGMPDGWDAADALPDMDWAKFREWAKPRVIVLSPPPKDPPKPPALKTPQKKTTEPKLPPQPDKNNAPQRVKSEVEPQPSHAIDPFFWDSILERTKAGYLNNLDNVVRVIENDPDIAGKIWYDEFLDQIVTTWQGKERTWRDSDDVLLQLYMQRHIGLQRIGVNTCHDAALVAAFRRPRNECREYLTSLKWDGAERLMHVMPVAFGSDDSEYASAVGRCWFISMVARVIRPGCKVDTVPVFEGSQGAGKSTALSVIGGKWFTECHESVLTKDFYGVLDGHMLVEISEMHSFTRAEVERVKGIISCQVDKYRKAYGRNTEPHPRQSVLACTTNRDDWNRDDTGARRFWPISCGHIDLDWLRTNRDQLFAEAVHLLNAGASWWDVPKLDQEAEVEKRRDVDVWEPRIDEWLVGRTRVTTQDVLNDCLKIEISRQDQLSQKRIARVMKALGWKMRVFKQGTRNVRTWYNDA